MSMGNERDLNMDGALLVQKNPELFCSITDVSMHVHCLQEV